MPERSPAPVPEFSEESIDETIEFWSPRYGRRLSREEAREILVNLTGFVRTLLRWHRKAQAAEAAEEPGAGGEGDDAEHGP